MKSSDMRQENEVDGKQYDLGPVLETEPVIAANTPQTEFLSTRQIKVLKSCTSAIYLRPELIETWLELRYPLAMVRRTGFNWLQFVYLKCSSM